MASVRPYFEFVCLQCSGKPFKGRKQIPIFHPRQIPDSDEYIGILTEQMNDEELLMRVCKTHQNPREEISGQLKYAINRWYISMGTLVYRCHKPGEPVAPVDDYNAELDRLEEKKEKDHIFLKQCAKR